MFMLMQHCVRLLHQRANRHRLPNKRKLALAPKIATIKRIVSTHDHCERAREREREWKWRPFHLTHHLQPTKWMDTIYFHQWVSTRFWPRPQRQRRRQSRQHTHTHTVPESGMTLGQAFILIALNKWISKFHLEIANKPERLGERKK